MGYKLITEISEDVEYLTEKTKEGKKALYITGPFMESGVVNRNGRRYPKSIMEKEVNRYISEKVNRGRAYGELNHPNGPSINLERACILINSLEMNGKGQVMGKARVTETPTGLIVKGLIESGANLGVSSRGLGSLKEVDDGIQEVQEDFKIVTASDVVADPSAPNAFVNGIMEGVDWVFNETTGEWGHETQKKLRTMSMSQIEDAKQVLFAQFLKQL